MIGFEHPWALALALPAAWLLWRARRQQVSTHVVPNLFLWMDGSAITVDHARVRRGSPPWLVWLQATTLVMLAVAIAAPSWSAGGARAVVVIDVSLSLSARDGSSTRFDEAKAEAEKWLQAQPSRTDIRIVAAAGSPSMVTSLDQLQVTGNTADLSAAIALARQVTSGDILVITDLPAPVALQDAKLIWKQVGAPADNVALTTLAGTDAGAAIVEVTNFGLSARAVDVTVTGGASPWREHVTLAPSDAQAFVLPNGPDRTLTAVLTTADEGNAITADDRQVAEIRSRPPTLIEWVGDNTLVTAALQALPLTNARRSPVDETASAADVRVCIVTCQETSTVPTLRFLPGGSLPAISRQEGATRSIAVAVDLSASTWPLTPAFPLFISDAVDWLARRAPASLTPVRAATIAESDTRHVAAPRVEAGLPLAPQARGRAIWLICAVVALVCLVVEVSVQRERPWTRAAGAALLGIGLLAWPLPLGRASREAALIVDDSASVMGQRRGIAARVRLETDAAASPDHLNVIRFGGTDTDIAAAIQSAAATLPRSGDRRLLLLSDGQETAGDARAAARAAGESGVPIDVVPIDGRGLAAIERVDVPARTGVAQALDISVSLTGPAGSTVRLTVSRAGADIADRLVTLDARGAAAVIVTDRPATSGVVFYHARLVRPELGVTLSEGGAAVTVAGRSRVLRIADQPRALARWLVSRAFDIVEARPEAVPDDRERLANFSAIVIDGVPLHRFSTQQLAAIADAVSVEGAGLLLVGSRDSLNASEFAPNPLVDALPLDLTLLPRPPATSTALALLVDISGSMASTSEGVTKISVAREAITRALAVMPATDAVEVIGFAADPVVLLRANDARDATSIARRLEAITPTGRTALAPAAREAAAFLESFPDARRRILLVTDGKTSSLDADEMRAAVRGRSIEVSAVTIGQDAERDWLSALTAETGGRAYFPDRLADLAREVAREAGRGATGREIDQPFAVRGTSHPLTPETPAPVLGGYVAARLRDGATSAWESSSGDAVLAVWPRGLGRAAVFTSDTEGPWGSALPAWAGNRTFWPRAVEWLARGSSRARVDATIDVAGASPRLVVERDPADGRDDAPRARAVIATPNGSTAPIQLHLVSPGRFEGLLPTGALTEPGDYRAAIELADSHSGDVLRSTTGWYWTGSLETQSHGPDLALLGDVARLSGGQLLPPLSATDRSAPSVFRDPRQSRTIVSTVWCFLAALILLSFDYIRGAQPQARSRS